MEQKEQRGNWSINFSSMAIGFLLALCLALALGAATSGESEGPYRCSAGSDMAVYVIDTQTAHVWRLSRGDNIDFGTPFDRVSRRKSVTAMVE